MKNKTKSLIGIFLVLLAILLSVQEISAAQTNPKMKITDFKILPFVSKGYVSGDTIQFQVEVKNTGKAAGKLRLDIHVDQYWVIGIGRKILVCTSGSHYCGNPSWGTVSFAECDGKLFGAGETALCTSKVKIPEDATVRKYNAYATAYTEINGDYVQGNTKSRYLKVIEKPKEYCNPRITIFENSKERPNIRAKVYVDGSEYGWIKDSHVKLEAGKMHTVTAEKAGYTAIGDWSHPTFFCNKDESLFIPVTLTPRSRK